MKRGMAFGIAALGLVALAACGERPQAAGTKKVDSKAWEAAQNPHVVAGWKAGDRASWEDQMRARAQVQNEYNRVK